MGPEGGTGGGKVAAQGTPDEIVAARTHTGQALNKVLHRACSAQVKPAQAEMRMR